MRIALIIIILNLFLVLLDYFSYKAINSGFNQILSKYLVSKILFFSTSGIFFVFLAMAFVKAFYNPDIYTANSFYMMIGLFALIFLPKLNLAVFYGLDSLSFWIFKKHFFVNYVGIALSTVAVLLVAHGMFINKTNFQVREQAFHSEKLTSNANPIHVIHISDLHMGSFHNDIDAVERIVKLINAEDPDLILFSGDMISNYAEEMDEFIPTLKKLSAKYGKYAVLGNHDYGEYVQWKSQSESVQNLVKLKEKHQQIGFTLLDNKNTTLNIKGQDIQIVGVENWGAPPFSQYGDLKKSIHGLKPEIFTILISHDPSHWRGEVLDTKFIDLTLSGHTHAMQYAFEFGSWQWSPVSVKYKEWGGLYQEDHQALYVNRGTGFIGFPGRIGVRPEITKLILKPKQ